MKVDGFRLHGSLGKLDVLRDHRVVVSDGLKTD